MTKFERELSGTLGDYWKVSTEMELKQIEKDLNEGKITIDASGVARNHIGRVLMNDLLEKLAYITDEVDIEATRAARTAEVSKSLEDYRRNASPASCEEFNEMRAAFGEEQTVENIITDRHYCL